MGDIRVFRVRWLLGGSNFISNQNGVQGFDDDKVGHTYCQNHIDCFGKEIDRRIKISSLDYFCGGTISLQGTSYRTRNSIYTQIPGKP